MDAREFLEAVTPSSSGYITIHGHVRDGGFTGKSCSTVEIALQEVARLKGFAHVNVYYCLSRQRCNSGQRNRKSALSLACAWADIDLANEKKPDGYKTKEEALQALEDFCAAADIPYPSIIIDSGGGLHVYWLSEITLSVEDWQPYADALKAAILYYEFKCDVGVTSDVVRVLRVPDTLNWKYDPPRRVQFEGGDKKKYDFSVIFGHLLDLAPTRFKAPDAFKDLPPSTLGEGITYNVKPVSIELLKKECPWLKEAHETGGRDYDQSQWNLLILCATFMEDGYDIAHELSNQYPTYDRDETDKFWQRKNREREARNLGWPGCRAIHGEGAKHCGTCPHLTEGKSPFHFARPAAFASSITEEEIRELGGTRPEDLRLPEGFAVNKEGFICAAIPRKLKGRIWQNARLQQILLSKISNPSLQFQRGQFGLAFTAVTDLQGTVEACICSGDIYMPKLKLYLASKGVLIMPGEENMALMEKLGATWLSKMLAEERAIRDAGTMGWRYDNGERIGFVYGDMFYRTDNEPFKIATSIDEFRGWYMPTGNKDAWLRAAKLITNRKRPELDMILAIAFAAPLIVFTGAQYGAILSVWGEPGTGKSTAQQVAAAVWGHPKQTRESLNSTAKSVQGRLGRTRNLPAYWDDIQDQQHQEALFQTMFVASQGAEGGRLHTDASMKERLEWQTLLVSCSNASFVEFLTERQKSTTAGIRRVFEVELNRNDKEVGVINVFDASREIAALEHNFGVMGMEYAKLLASQHKQIEQLTVDTTNTFMKQLDVVPDENYWAGICGTLLTGATMANALGAEIDGLALEKFLAKAFLSNREIRREGGTEGGGDINTENALTSFINQYINSNSIAVENQYHRRNDIVILLREPSGGRPIFIQVVRDERKILISRRAFRDYLLDKNINVKQALRGLDAHFAAKDIKSTLAAGTRWAQTQEHCIELTIPLHGPNAKILAAAIHAHGAPAGEAASRK